MEEIHFADITTAYVGRTDQSGWRITWVAGHGTDRHAIGVVHEETDVPQVWELLPETIVWLRSPRPVPSMAETLGRIVAPRRWREIAEQVAAEVAVADAREAVWRDRYEHALIHDEVTSA